MPIHPSSIIADGAIIPGSCSVGPFCTIGPNVILGEDCELISHVVLDRSEERRVGKECW